MLAVGVAKPLFLEHVERFAASQDDWFAQFKAAFEKLLRLGTSNLTSLRKPQP